VIYKCDKKWVVVVLPMCKTGQSESPSLCVNREDTTGKKKSTRGYSAGTLTEDSNALNGGTGAWGQALPGPQ